MATDMEIMRPVTWARPLAATLSGLVKIVEIDSFSDPGLSDIQLVLLHIKDITKPGLS